MIPASSAWPLAATLIAVLAAFTVIAMVALSGTAPRDRPAILRALAELLRAAHRPGRRE